MIDRTWLPWPTHAGWWWCHKKGWSEPSLARVDDRLNVVIVESGWLIGRNYEGLDFRFLDARLVRPEAP